MSFPRAVVQGDPSGQQLYFVDFDLGVPPCCQHAMPILPDLQLPQQNKADTELGKIAIFDLDLARSLMVI